MNKYKGIYYLCIVVFIVNLLAMIGTLFGWFTVVESKYLISLLDKFSSTISLEMGREKDKV